MISTPPALPADGVSGSSALPSGPTAWVLVIVAVVGIVLLLIFIARHEGESDSS
jgi:hypothetical protein